MSTPGLRHFHRPPNPSNLKLPANCGVRAYTNNTIICASSRLASVAASRSVRPFSFARRPFSRVALIEDDDAAGFLVLATHA
jgi:hypothetical protein